MHKRILSLVFVVITASAASLQAGDWPAFRGPNGNGIADEPKAPLRWSSDDNIAWKTPIGPGNGSPIVSNGKVFVLNATDSGRKRSLHCLDRKTGKSLWVKSVKFDKKDPTHQTNPYCGSTPASNGKIVLAWHGSAGLYAYDHSGKQLWKKELGEFKHMWGYGTSPLINGDQVIMHSGPGKRIFMGAYNINNGDTIWENDEPQDGDGQRRTKDGSYMGSWATPILATIGGKRQLICTMPTRVNGYDVKSGKILWWCNGISGQRGDLAYSSPIVAGDLCYANGGYMGPAIGFPLGGSGDLTTKRLWRVKQTHQNIGSGVFVNGHIYKANAGPNSLECIDPKTGVSKWLHKRSKAGNHWGSIIHAAGRLYVTGQKGITLVYQASPKKFNLLAANDLKERCNATPAFSDGQIFIRTYKHVYCIGK